jgi:hypothetical protein
MLLVKVYLPSGFSTGSKLTSEGKLSVIRAGEEIVSVSDVKHLKSRIRVLDRFLSREEP